MADAAGRKDTGGAVNGAATLGSELAKAQWQNRDKNLD